MFPGGNQQANSLNDLLLQQQFQQQILTILAQQQQQQQHQQQQQQSNASNRLTATSGFSGLQTSASQYLQQTTAQQRSSSVSQQQMPSMSALHAAQLPLSSTPNISSLAHSILGQSRVVVFFFIFDDFYNLERG